MSTPKNDSTTTKSDTSRLRHLNSKWVHTYRGALWGLLLGFTVVIITIRFDLDLFESFVVFLQKAERYELDELIFPLLIFLTFTFINLVRIARKRYIENQRIEVYKNMMEASNHVIKTCLNQMMLVRITAEETPGFDETVLDLFDQIVSTANAQLEALGKLKDPTVEAIWQTIYNHDISLNENGVGK